MQYQKYTVKAKPDKVKKIKKTLFQATETGKRDQNTVLTPPKQRMGELWGFLIFF